MNTKTIWVALLFLGWGCAGCTTLRVSAALSSTETPTVKPTFTPRPTSTRWLVETNPGLAGVTPAPGDSAAADFGFVTGMVSVTLNVRLGPGLVYPIVSKLPADAEVHARGRDPSGSWLALAPPVNGWVKADWVNLGPDIVERLPILPVPPTPVPTWTVAPTPTVPPTPTPVMHVDFRADLTLIPADSCTTLRWDVEGVSAIYLDGQGQPGHGTLEVCTHTPRTFVLNVVPRNGVPFNRSVTVGVYPVPTASP